MTLSGFFKNNRIIVRYYIRTALIVGIIWTIFDYTSFLSIAYSEDVSDYPFPQASDFVLWTRVIVSFIGYFILGYLLIFPLKVKLRNVPLWLVFIIKTIVLSFLSAVLVSIVFFIVYLVANGNSPLESLNKYVYYVFDTRWMFNFIQNRIMLFLLTLIGLEIGEKYSPGVFTDIFLGKYIRPREQNRIIVFIDLVDSTPIAEQLGHKVYFNFIKDFIHHISTALLEYDGLIYQYVGDEIVVSWILNKTNRKKSINSLRRARLIIERESSCYLKTYGVKPEFRAGIHCGAVTVGEIGIVKKDLAITGEAMNATARIRSMTGQLNVQFLASKDFVDSLDMKPGQYRSVGQVEMKGLSKPLELFSILE